MMEDSLKERLGDAYAVRRLSDERLDTIARNVRVREASKRRFRFLGRVAFACAFAAAAGFTYPIAAANLFSHQLRERMAASGPYLVKITMLGQDTHDQHYNRETQEMIVDGRSYFLPHLSPVSSMFEAIDAGKRLLIVHPDSGVSFQYPADEGSLGLYNLPLAFFEKLTADSKFAFDKRLEDRGFRSLSGRNVHEFVLKTGGKADFIADLDPDTNLLVSTTIPSLSVGGGPWPKMNFGVRFDYEYGASAIRDRINDLKKSIRSTRVVDKERDEANIRRTIFARPLATKETGRDHLRIYQVQEDPSGNVFVLYTCDGYHGDDEMQRNWLEMRDASGTHWLSAVVDMTFSELGPKGQDAKAQIFYNPAPSKHAGFAWLSLRQNEWEYLAQDEPSIGGAHVVELGSFQPAPVRSVPDWFFYNFSASDEGWVPAMGQTLRFRQAMAQRDFRRVIAISKTFEGWDPADMGSLFFTRYELYKGLTQAYQGLGDHANVDLYRRRAQAEKYQAR